MRLVIQRPSNCETAGGLPPAGVELFCDRSSEGKEVGGTVGGLTWLGLGLHNARP